MKSTPKYIEVPSTLSEIIPKNIIGIDMGHSLSKIVYREENKLSLHMLPTQKNTEKIETLITSKEGCRFINFTGGKAFQLFKRCSKEFETKLLNEFQAITKGSEMLFQIEKGKQLYNSLVVTLGTGTSMVLKKDKFEHLGGTALGGAYFMALMKTLYNITDYENAINLAQKGNRYNIDLKVSDIYDRDDDRVNLIFREFTAASLGKIDKDFNLNSVNKEDVANSLICMIGENIGTIACLMSEKSDIENILFCGGFLSNNRTLKKILSLLCKVNNKKAIFLKNSIYIGALGAIIS